MVVLAAGHQVVISHPEKVLFEERGDTKLRPGPLLPGRRRAPDRAPWGAARCCCSASRTGRRLVVLPEAGPRQPARTGWRRHRGRTPNGTTSQALVAADLAHVLWAVNLACLGFHVWPYQAADPEHADELRIDLDPTPGVTFAMVQEAAHEVHALFEELGVSGPAQDDGQPGHPRLRPPPAALDLLRGPRRRRRRRPRARAPAARSHHGGVVERGAGPAGLRRLQPERPAQDDLRGLVGPGPAGRPGVDPVRLGRARRHRPRRAHHRRRCRPGWPRRGDPWAAMEEHPQSLEPLLALHERDRAAGLADAPWPPVYPKMPGEPPRVAPSRARKPSAEDQ